MTYRQHLLSFLLLFGSLTIIAQEETSHEAPTLQVGLGGLNFQKGILDSELILTIIAEKQQEVKAELIKNMLLGKLDLGGGAFYMYVDNVISTLLSKKDVEITNRALLESTINIVFTYAFVDYFVRTASSEDHVKINKLAMGLGYVLPGNRKEIDAVRYLADFTHPRFTNYNFKNAEKNNNLDYANQNEALTQLVGVLIDIGAEVIRNSDFLRQRGLLQAPYHSGYQSQNTYLSMPYCADVKEFTNLRQYVNYAEAVEKLSNQDITYEQYNTKLTELRDNHELTSYATGTKCFADDIYESMESRMNEILRYVGLVYYLRDLSEMSTERLGSLQPEDIKKVLFKTLKNKSKDELIDEATKTIKKIIAEDPGEEAQKVLSDALQMLSRLRRSDLKQPALNNNSQMLFFLKSYVLPVLSDLIYKSPASVDLSELLEDLGALVARELFDELGDKHTMITSRQKTAFLNLLSRLYEFDKPETISAYLNILPEIGEIFPNSSVQQSISIVSSFLKQYSTFGTGSDGEEYMNIDVEGMLLRLKEIKLNRYRPLEFHFTVGSNTLFFDDKLTKLDDGGTLKSVSVVGEKIGLKFKFADWEYLSTFNKGETFKYYGKYYTRTTPPKRPVVSNFHLLAYGSGLLYNLANSTTEDSFNAPVFGLNLGLTFFNNLDFSAGRGVAILDSNVFSESSAGFWSFGFDIQFGEYLNRLNQKRRDKKQSKTIEKHLLAGNSN